MAKAAAKESKVKMSKAIIEKQITDCQSRIANLQNLSMNYSDMAKKELGVLDYCKHLLEKFDLPTEKPK